MTAKIVSVKIFPPKKATVVKVQDKHIGWVWNKTFIAFRTEAKHMYRNGIGKYQEALRREETYWAIDAAAVEQMNKLGVLHVMIIGKDEVYTTALVNFLTHVDAKVLDFPDQRKQYALHFRAFDKEDRGYVDWPGLEAAGIKPTR
jgi:hypothetical protein